MGESQSGSGFEFTLPGNIAVSVRRLEFDKHGVRIVPLGIRLRLFARRITFASKLIGLITASVFGAPRRA